MLEGVESAVEKRGPWVTVKMFPGFLLLGFFLDGVFVVLGFFGGRGVCSSFSLSSDVLLVDLAFLGGGGIHSSSSLPSPVPMLSILRSISLFVPTATTWEMCFSHPFTLHIAPGTSSSKGDKIFVTATKEWRFSSGHRIRQWVTA